MRKVVKLGSSSLFNGAPKSRVFNSIAGQVSNLRNEGHDVVVVSSGAIAFGKNRLGIRMPTKELDIETKQALAAVGQPHLMAQWSRAFEGYDVQVGQALLTSSELTGNDDDIGQIASTFNRLFDLGVVPIVNENDTVATAEIKFGDNDQLAAHVAKAIGASTLHLLGSVDAVYADFPANTKPLKTMLRTEFFNDVTERIVKDTQDADGSGGMTTKLLAAKIFVDDGKDMFVAKADIPGVIDLAEAGETGTRFYSPYKC